MELSARRRCRNASVRPTGAGKAKKNDRTRLECSARRAASSLGKPGSSSRAHSHCGLSPDALAVHRFRLPAPADLFAICRRGFCAPRLLGRWLDDARATAALSSVRHLRPRLCSRGGAARCSLVPAVALWPLAWQGGQTTNVTVARNDRYGGASGGVPSSPPSRPGPIRSSASARSPSASAVAVRFAST
jgi:hypothetical protein